MAADGSTQGFFVPPPAGPQQQGEGAPFNMHSPPPPMQQQHAGFGAPMQPMQPMQPQQQQQQQMPMPSTSFGGMTSVLGLGGGVLDAQQRLQGAQAWYQSTKDKYFAKGKTSMLRYYFDVSQASILQKLKVLLVPFIHRNWERIPEQVAGGITYKSSKDDNNAPDLYLGINAFVTYVLLVLLGMAAVFQSTSSAGGAATAPLVIAGNATEAATTVLTKACASSVRSTIARTVFSTDRMGIVMWRSAATWVIEMVALRIGLYVTSMQIKAPWLDLLSYSGYLFVYASLCRLASFASTYVSLGLWLYMSAAYGLFLAKTMQRVMTLESRNYGVHARQSNPVLIANALLQFVMLRWLLS